MVVHFESSGSSSPELIVRTESETCGGPLLRRKCGKPPPYRLWYPWSFIYLRYSQPYPWSFIYLRYSQPYPWSFIYLRYSQPYPWSLILWVTQPYYWPWFIICCSTFSKWYFDTLILWYSDTLNYSTLFLILGTLSNSTLVLTVILFILYIFLELNTCHKL